MIIVGIDEVGRGCWAGPLVAGAVVLPDLEDGPMAKGMARAMARDVRRSLRRPRGGAVRSMGSAGVPGAGPPIILRDSKQMTKRQREIAAVWVHEHALAVGLGWVSPAELDSGGISRAVKTAMERALEQAAAALAAAGVSAHHGAAPAAAGLPANDAASAFDEVIVDGNINYLAAEPRARAVIKADATVPAVSAASIVAKVARDAYMAGLQADARYAGYGFDRHVGYGTAAHVAALRELGVSDLHRRSFRPVRELLAAEPLAGETTGQ